MAASACGDSGGSGGPPAASQLYESWSSTFCDVLTSCPVADEDLSFFKLLASADEAACRSFVGRLFDQRRPEENLETIIAQGRVTYHGDQLSGCLSAARSACSVELDEVAACAGVFEGMVATDGACWVHEECAGDAFCEQSDSDCVGVCKPRPKRGEACWYGDCSQTEGPSDCGGAGTCVPRVTVEGGAVGSPCGTEWGDAEVTERRCAAGLACDYDFDADASECVALGAEGQACGGDADPHCGAGLACATPPGGASTCKKVAIATNVGASCNETDPSQPLVGCNIFKRLVCDGGTCEALGDGSLGSACAPNVDLDGICDYGTHCDGERAVCAAPKADGERCESGSECASGVCSFTSGDSGTCHPLSCD
ncbi:MAG: hypothetical protein CVU56_10225 [Deltaproteobacteria bacterium HGW-Deltaproteobacteria-14]|nr:MAG: hypothetical protein CVU56_10225 [Deltaproteobacteria bacterium HGW-Deltaproteobacteria-14]